MRPNVQDISHLAPATAGYSMNNKVLSGIPVPIDVTDAVNKSYADSLIDGKTLNFWGVPTLDLSIGSKKLTNVGSPTAASDASTKKYVDDNVSSLLLNIAGINMATIGAPIANVNFNNKKIINLAEPTLLTDGATKNYVDSKVVAGSGVWSVPTSNLSMGGQRLTTLADPVDLQDAATRKFVNDSIPWIQTTLLQFGEIPSTPSSFLPARVKGTNFFGYGTSCTCVGWCNDGELSFYYWRIVLPDAGFNVMPVVQHTIQPQVNFQGTKWIWYPKAPIFVQTIEVQNYVGAYALLNATTDNRTTFIMAVSDSNYTYPTYDVNIIWVKRPTE